MIRSKLFSIGIILLLAITMSTAAQIDGVWQVNKSNDLVEIRSTSQGIKAKFVGSQDWDQYEFLRKDIYEDRKGNRYYVKARNRLTWESRDGRRVINLEKSENSGRSGDRYDDYNYSRNDIGQYDDGISGTWTTRRRNLIAYVEYDGLNLRMKTNQSRRWITYRRTNNRRSIFRDKYGNRLRIRNNGRLEWRRADGRREIDFFRGRF